MNEPSVAADTVRTHARLGWRRTSGVLVGAATAMFLAAGGLVLGRIDVALLALPIVLAVAGVWERRPGTEEEAIATLELADDGDKVRYRLTLEAPASAQLAVVRASTLGDAEREFVLALPQRREFSGAVPVLHSGPQELARVDYRFLAADAGYASLPAEPIVGVRVIAPGRLAIRALPLPLHLRGLVGVHESVRIGDGGEFRDIHPFSPGDRLRRIDWKATARRGQSAADLYVRRTHALADATVLVVMDSRDDVGEQVAEWSDNTPREKGISALDLAREAAGSLAAAYIAAGDRVGFQDLSSRERLIPHASGQRQLWRLLRVIEATAPADVPFRHQRPPIVPAGAIVYLLSSFLDDRSVQLALTWMGTGHRVIAVDTLPPARFDRTNRFERVAHRMLMMERDDRIRILRSRGVEMLSWSATGDALPLATRLDLLSRPMRRRGAVRAGR